MITANQANQKVNKSLELASIEIIYDHIEKAIVDNNFHSTVLIKKKTSEETRNRIAKHFVNLGYTVHATVSKNMFDYTTTYRIDWLNPKEVIKETPKIHIFPN